MARHDFNPASVSPDGRAPMKRRIGEWAPDAIRRGVLEGAAIGASVTVLHYGTDEIGAGPRLHVHPYDELFIVQEGHARFFIGDQVIDAVAGEAVLGPKALPHRFVNLGPGRLQTTDIHLSPRWIQTDMD